MKIILNSANIPITINIMGDINEVDFSWRIKPIMSHLKNENIEKLYESLYKMKKCALEKSIYFKIKASFLFKSAFFFFCKESDLNT